MSANISAGQQAVVNAIVEERLILNWSCAALFMFVLYDWIICFGDEVQYIWSSKWSLAKFIYLFSRYFSIIDFSIIFFVVILPNPPLSLCKFYFPFWGLGTDLASVAVTVLQCLRIHALYPKNKPLLTFLYTATLVQIAINFLFTGLTEDQIDFIIVMDGCVLSQIPSRLTNSLAVTGLAVFCFIHGIFAILTINKGYSAWKSQVTRSPLMHSLVRDGSAVFVVIFVSSLFSALTTLFPLKLKFLLLFFSLLQSAFNWLSCCYLIIGLRSAQGAFITPSVSMASIRYRRNPFLGLPRREDITELSALQFARV